MKFLRGFKEIWVAKACYHIVRKKLKNDWGYCDVEKYEVGFDTKMTRLKQVEIFIHEFNHAIESEYDIELDHDTLTILSRAWAKLIFDNFL